MPTCVDIFSSRIGTATCRRSSTHENSWMDSTGGPDLARKNMMSSMPTERDKVDISTRPPERPKASRCPGWGAAAPTPLNTQKTPAKLRPDPDLTPPTFADPFVISPLHTYNLSPGDGTHIRFLCKTSPLVCVCVCGFRSRFDFAAPEGGRCGGAGRKGVMATDNRT